jgi:hypothetical protein
LSKSRSAALEGLTRGLNDTITKTLQDFAKAQTFRNSYRQELLVRRNELINHPAALQVQGYRKLQRIEGADAPCQAVLPDQAIRLLEMLHQQPD